MSKEQHGHHVARFIVRIVGDRGLHQNVGSAPTETAHQSPEELARRLVGLTEEGRLEIEIDGEAVEPELIGYWRMLAEEALNYPGEFDQLVRSIERNTV